MVDRRTALKLSAKAFAAVCAAFPVLLAACATPEGAGSDSGGDTGGADEGPLRYAQLLERVATLAELQFDEGWDREAYVADVALLMSALDLDDPDLLALYSDYADRVRDFPEITTVEDNDLFEVSVLQFEAGDVIPLHDHPDMTGVILCVRGAVDIENFDVLDEASASGRLLLRRASQGTLRAGEVGTLTVDAGNVHTLTATEFTELLDVFTPGYNRDRALRSRYFARDAAAYDGRDGVYEADVI